MRYLIDGYNVTRRDPATDTLTLQEQRDALVRRLAARGSALLGSGAIIVIFDGRSGMGGGDAPVTSVVEVRFSRDETADDLIARMAEGAPRGSVTVVTDDGGLVSRVRGFGAHVLSATAVFESAAPKRRRVRAMTAQEGLPPGAREITAELEGIWLSEEE